MTRIERVDVGDQETFAAFHDVYARAHERDVDLPYSAIEKRAGMRPDEYVDKVVLLARDAAGTPVGGGTVELPLRDNTDVVYLDVFTAPEHRRNGHATALVEAVEELAGDADRGTLLAYATWEIDAVDPGPQAFAEAVGFDLNIMNALRELPLPASIPPLEVADGYTMHTWRAACPEAWLQGYIDVRRLIVEEAPRGDAELENEYWDAARVRSEEAQWVEQGRTPQVTMAVSDDGEVVGHTQLLFPSDSDEVYQWDTIVLPTHRGHGLGLSLKIAAMHEAADLLAGRRRITTYNAASNAPMIRVNDALGFRQIAWDAEYVREL